MTKINTICLSCGKVQVRTDLNIIENKNYVFLKGKQHCPNCESFTPHVATKDIKVLRKKLTENCERGQDKKVLELIKR